MDPEQFGYIPVPEAYTRAAYEPPMLVRVDVGDTEAGDNPGPDFIAGAES